MSTLNKKHDAESIEQLNIEEFLALGAEDFEELGVYTDFPEGSWRGILRAIIMPEDLSDEDAKIKVEILPTALIEATRDEDENFEIPEEESKAMLRKNFPNTGKGRQSLLTAFKPLIAQAGNVANLLAHAEQGNVEVTYSLTKSTLTRTKDGEKLDKPMVFVNLRDVTAV